MIILRKNPAESAGQNDLQWEKKENDVPGAGQPAELPAAEDREGLWR